MGRIRTVKPELFRHLALFEAEEKYQLPLRIAFVGLFTCCDRQGRFIWQPKRLKVDILPYDEIDISDVLNALLDNGFIKAYEVKGVIYGCIPTWVAHQYVNTKEANSQLPDITQGKILKAPIIQSMLSVHARLSQESLERILGERSVSTSTENSMNEDVEISEKPPERTVPLAEIPLANLTPTIAASRQENLIREDTLLFNEDNLTGENDNNTLINKQFSRVPHACVTGEALIGKEGKGKKYSRENKKFQTLSCAIRSGVKNF